MNSSQSIKDIANSIKEQSIEKIKEYTGFNRKQRRAIQKKLGRKGRAQRDVVADTATKLNYIDLIQKLRALNEKKEKENEIYEDSTEDN